MSLLVFFCVHLEDLHGGDVGGQPGERLLSASSDSDEESIPARTLYSSWLREEMIVKRKYLEDPVDAAHVGHRILKEDKVHH